MVPWMLVASELATAGSVMAKAERIRPARRRVGVRCAGIQGRRVRTFEERLEPLLLLLLVSVLDQDLHVARVRGGTVETFGCKWDRSHDFCKSGVLLVGQSVSKLCFMVDLEGNPHIP